ncbi:hypothetical protein NQ315_014363, partial [Exocentrus adspersus]
QQKENTTIEDVLAKYVKGEYKFTVGQTVNAYNPVESKDLAYKVHQIDSNCLGITTAAFETIVLECQGKKPEKPGCFSVFTPRTSPKTKTMGATVESKRHCVRTIGAFCVGIFTPLTWTILFDCLPSSVIVPQYGIDVPRNGPPDRQ